MVRTPAHASAKPAASPSAVSSTLSASTGRTTAHRPPPNAARTAISRRRWTPRASNRLATLDTAISSTMHTAPNTSSRGVRTALTASASSGTTRMDSLRRFG